MTEIQKSEILCLREAGLSYAEIGAQLALSPNTVKSYCQRKSASKPVPEPVREEAKSSDGSCLQCSKPLCINEKGKPRKFCSDHCRQAWWNAHRDQLAHRSARETLVCPGCGKNFERYQRSKARFCSHKCYILWRFPL